MDVLIPSTRRARANYTFSASAEVSSSGTTNITFVSPRAPYAVSSAAPTIVRRFGPLNANLDSTEPTGAHGSEPQQVTSRTQSRASSAAPPQQATGLRELGSRASSVAPRQLTPGPRGVGSRAPSTVSRQLTPATPELSSRASTPASVPPRLPTPTPSLRSTRSSTAAQREAALAPTLDTPAAQGRLGGSSSRHQSVPPSNFADYLPPRSQSVPPANFGDYLPPRSAARSQRSGSSHPGPSPGSSAGQVPAPSRSSPSAEDEDTFDPMTAIRETRACQKSDEEKLNAASRKGKAPAEKHQTAWFESYGASPRISPPEGLATRPDLELGDIFYHRSDEGIQLWMWFEDADKGAYWRPMLLGYKREEDGRFLALTPSYKPTWNGKAWFRKKQGSQPRVFILKK